MISCHIWYTGRNTIIEVDHHKNNATKAILAKLVSNMSQVTNTHHVGHDAVLHGGYFLRGPQSGHKCGAPVASAFQITCDSLRTS